MYLRGIGGTPCVPGVAKIAREKRRETAFADSARFEDLEDAKYLKYQRTNR